MEQTIWRYLGAALLINLACSTWAQNETDALRFSTLTQGGTARSNGMANAFGALGADPVAVAINPAGLGLYRTSEISFTPALDVNTAHSRYNGTLTTDQKARFNFSNLALILNSPAEQAGSDWRSSTFGVIFNRQATHHWGRQALADGVRTSILDDLAGKAEGTLANDLYATHGFDAGLAYDTYAINPVDPTDTLGRSYVPALPAGALVDQSITIDARGATNNTAFFYSGNYMDRLYLGMSLGIVGYRYKHTRIHTETVPDASIDLKELRYREELSIAGNGVELKAGVIYRFHDRFRAGLAFHGPMWMTMNDAYNTSMNTTFRTPSATDGRTTYTSSSPDGVFAYKLSSPFRAVASAAYIVGQHGLVSVDYTYADHTTMRFRPGNQLDDNYTFTSENEVIRQVFRPTHSVRAGTEWRSGAWYFRLGWGFVPDAYRIDDMMHAQATRTYAGGLGYRTDHLSVDLGANYIESHFNYFPYDPALANSIREERNTVRTLLTIAIRP